MTGQEQQGDPLESILRKAQLSDRQRAGLWDMYEASRNQDDLSARLKSIEIPQEIKAQLWDLKSQESPTQPSDALPPMRPVSSHGPKDPTWSERLGLNEPTASPMVGFMRGAGTGLVDLVQGAVSNVMGQLNSKLDKDNDLRRGAGMAETMTMPRVERPQNFSGGVGAALPIVAEMALPGGASKAVSVAKAALPSATRAGANFEKVMGAAKDIPVNVEPVGKVALRIMDLAERGGSMPKAVRDVLKRITDPNKAPMTYQESRDFASNIGRLSVDEMNRLTPAVKRQVAELAAELNKANAEAARAAGKAAEYKSAMREYASAMRMKEAIDKAIKYSKKAALGAAGVGGAAYWLNRD